MTKQETILWLRRYIEQERIFYENQRVVNVWEDKIREHTKPLKEEKKAGVLGSAVSGLVVAIVGAIPCAIVFSAIWFVWLLVDLFKTNLREHPDAVLLPSAVVEKAAGIVIKQDVNEFFFHHELLGPIIGLLVIGFGISCVLGFFAVFIVLFSDKDIPKRNAARKEEYAKRQALLPQLRMTYNLHLEKMRKAETKLMQMKKNAIISEKYLDYASDLLEFLETGRADTLKEALNLLHTEWHERERLHEMRRHHQAVEEENEQLRAELRRNTEASERAADAAEDAAYWDKKRYVDDIFDELLK